MGYHSQNRTAVVSSSCHQNQNAAKGIVDYFHTTSQTNTIVMGFFGRNKTHKHHVQQDDIPPRYSEKPSTGLDADNEPVKKPSDYAGEEEKLTISVGAKEVEYQVSETRICMKSALLDGKRSRRAFQPVPAVTPYSLASTEPDTFEAYLHWVHHDVIPKATQLELGKLYLLAETLQDPLLQNTIVDTLLEDQRPSQKGFKPNLIAHMYMHATASSQLYKMVRDDSIAHSGFTNSEWFRTVEQTLPKKFYVEMAVGLSKRLGKDGQLLRPYKAAKCTYHVHNMSVPRCTQKSS